MSEEFVAFDRIAPDSGTFGGPPRLPERVKSLPSRFTRDVPPGRCFAAPIGAAPGPAKSGYSGAPRNTGIIPQ